MSTFPKKLQPFQVDPENDKVFKVYGQIEPDGRKLIGDRIANYMELTNSEAAPDDSLTYRRIFIETLEFREKFQDKFLGLNDEDAGAISLKDNLKKMRNGDSKKPVPTYLFWYSRYEPEDCRLLMEEASKHVALLRKGSNAERDRSQHIDQRTTVHSKDGAVTPIVNSGGTLTLNIIGSHSEDLKKK